MTTNKRVRPRPTKKRDAEVATTSVEVVNKHSKEVVAPKSKTEETRTPVNLDLQQAPNEPATHDVGYIEVKAGITKSTAPYEFARIDVGVILPFVYEFGGSGTKEGKAVNSRNAKAMKAAYSEASLKADDMLAEELTTLDED